MLYLVNRVTISIKLRPVKLEQAVSESLPHKGLYTELLGVQLKCLNPVPASIRARNAQEINITNCDVTTWSWVNLVHPLNSGHPGADPGGGGGGGHGGPMPPPPPPFGIEPARNAEVCYVLSARSYFDAVHISVRITASCPAYIEHSNCSSQVEETVLWQCLKHKG